MSDIIVVGSINMDVTAVTDRYPARGETRFGTSVEVSPGGKGATQAVTCAKLGKDVHMVGCVGGDIYGSRMVDGLKGRGVNTDYVFRSSSPSGTVIVTLDSTAENTMLVIKGANDDLSPEDIQRAMNQIDNNKVVLLQMEVQTSAVIEAMKYAKDAGWFVILDPAPAQGICSDAFAYADVVTPNLQETKEITGIDVTSIETAVEAARFIENLGVKNAIIKMSEKGSVVYQTGEWEFVDAVPVQAVDTVGAGDCFAGALACAIVDGQDLVSAARFATIASALKVTRLGAQAGIPTMDDINRFCREKGLNHYLMPEQNVSS
jgi:ribokinase